MVRLWIAIFLFLASVVLVFASSRELDIGTLRLLSGHDGSVNTVAITFDGTAMIITAFSWAKSST